MADNDVASSNAGIDAGDHAAVAKIDVARDGTPSSMESTPEADGGIEATQEPAAQPQKRKGGRKPVSCQIFLYRVRNRPGQIRATMVVACPD